MENPNKHALTVFVVSLVCLTAERIQAQALPTASGPGSYISVGGGVSVYQADYGKQDIAGYTVFTDLHPTWRYSIEAEARFLHYNASEDVTETNYLIGPLVAIRPGPLRPYVKFLVGDGKIVFPFKYAVGSYLAYAPGGGVEYLFKDRIAVRLIDFEYQVWPSFSFGQLHPYGISAGVSLRLNQLLRVPNHAR